MQSRLSSDTSISVLPGCVSQYWKHDAVCVTLNELWGNRIRWSARAEEDTALRLFLANFSTCEIPSEGSQTATIHLLLMSLNRDWRQCRTKPGDVRENGVELLCKCLKQKR